MSRVTVAQLREALENYDDDLEVRIVHQPGWPLQEVLGGLYEPDGAHCAFDDCDYEGPASIHQPGAADFDHEFVAPDGPAVLFLVADGHPREGSPYGSKDAWDGMQRL